MADIELWIGAVVSTLAAGAALVSRDPRRRAVAMALALALAPVLIAAEAWDDERFRDLRESPVILAAALAAGAALLAALATVIRRHPPALALLAVAALPFRIPVEAGGGSANLLLPLYVVIAAGALAALIEAIKGSAVGGRTSEPEVEGEATDVGRGARGWWPFRVLPAALAAYLVLYAVQGLYSDDFSNALENIGFFFVPFAVLAALLMRIEWTPRLLSLVLAVVLAEAALFAVVGFAQYGLRELFWNPAIIEANEQHAYFRVNSLFWDPNILGRYLALTIVAVAALMLWERRSRRAALCGAGAAVLLAALAITFSQSSLIALLAALAMLAALRWSALWTGALCALAAIIVAVGALASGADVDTSGRGELIRGGLELAEDRPIAGWGSGSFEKEFDRRFRSGKEAARAVSHTEPVTVAAEQGAVGFLVYLAVLALALVALATGIRPFAPGLGGGGRALSAEGGRTVAVARAALLAGLVAMIVHSLSYAAFFIDPITWTMLALGLALARRPPATAPAERA